MVCGFAQREPLFLAGAENVLFRYAPPKVNELSAIRNTGGVGNEMGQGTRNNFAKCAQKVARQGSVCYKN
jgi:hypothetical protein